MGTITDFSVDTSVNKQRYAMFAGLGLAGIIGGVVGIPDDLQPLAFVATIPVGNVIGSNIRGPTDGSPYPSSIYMQSYRGAQFGTVLLPATFTIGTLLRQYFF